MMNPQNYYAVILASGTGVRLWPVSTTKKPKQFLDILGIGKTFIQLTYDRLKKVVPEENIFVLTTEDHKELVLEQIPSITQNKLIIEPRIMKTAACNLLAAKIIHQINKEAKIIISPSNHLIFDSENFVKSVNIAFENANEDNLILLGAEPNRADTNLSYVQFLENGQEIKKVKTFVDKPDEEFAQTFIDHGDFLWNTGALIWSTVAILKAFEKYCPTMVESLDSYFNQTDQSYDLLKPIYNSLDVLSINQAILDKAQNVYVIPTNMGWNDFGTWDAIDSFNENNQSKKSIFNRNVIKYNTTNTFVYSANKKAIIVDGLDDYVVIDSSNGLLICPKKNIREVKTYVSDLKLNKGDKFC